MGTGNYCVYILTCNITGMKYVGKTNDFDRRMNEHRNGSDNQTDLQEAIRVCGWQSFGAEIYDQNLTYGDATRLEAMLISNLNTYLFGYNMTRDG